MVHGFKYIFLLVLIVQSLSSISQINGVKDSLRINHVPVLEEIEVVDDSFDFNIESPTQKLDFVKLWKKRSNNNEHFPNKLDSVSKLVINKDLTKHENKYQLNGFDDYRMPEKKFSQFNINYGLIIEKKDKSIVITNKSSFKIISIEINEKLEIINTTYDELPYCYPTKQTFEVEGIFLSLSQNPFKNIDKLRGSYILNIKYNDEYSNTFIGKFKSYNGVSTKSEEYEWIERVFKMRNRIMDLNDVYIKPDKKAVLTTSKTELKEQLIKIKKEHQLVNNRIACYFTIDEQGKVLSESFKFRNLDNKVIIEKIKMFILEKTDWSPAIYENKKVKSKKRLVI